MAPYHPPATSRHAAVNEDGALDTPLHRLPGFGTGLYRQRVAFVKAGETPQTNGRGIPAGNLPGGAVSDLYLSIVMGASATTASTDDDRPQSAPPLSLPLSAPAPVASSSSSSFPPPMCDICRLPLNTTRASAATAHHHETCLVHQVALDHSKPPSALDRSRFGLAVMSAQGWDPDSGRGLGRDQQGMPYPVEARLRPDRQALGSTAPTTQSLSTSAGSSTAPTQRSNRQAHTRKQLRMLEEARRRRHDRLREQIMGHRDLDKYLRPQGGEEE